MPKKCRGAAPGGSVETPARNLQEHLYHRNAIRIASICGATPLHHAITMEAHTHADMNDKCIAMDALQEMLA